MTQRILSLLVFGIPLVVVPCSVIVWSVADGQQPGPRIGNAAQRVRLVPHDAAKIALADAQSIPVGDVEFMRYVFLNADPKRDVAVVDGVVNLALSRSSFIQHTHRVHEQLLRIDLRRFAPVKADLDNLIETFEELRTDPYFHEVLEDVKDVVKSKRLVLEHLRGFKMKFVGHPEQYRLWSRPLHLDELESSLARKSSPDMAVVRRAHAAISRSVQTDEKSREHLSSLSAALGKMVSGGTGSSSGEDLAIPAKHAGEALELLIQLVKSDAAIVTSGHFIHRALNTVDLGHGEGLYYRFAGVRGGQNGLTDFDQLLKDLGVDVSSIERLRADQAAAIYNSKVTGKVRKVVFLYGQGVRPTAGTGLVVYTEDPNDEQVAAENNPFRNLIKFNFAARELIAERNNGTLLFALFDADGNLQNSAPDNVVADHTVPAPYTRRLQGAISCLRCHGPQRGHQDVVNDVQRLTKSGADVLDDLASRLGLQDQIDRFVGQYEGDLIKPLNRSREDFSDAVFRATKGMAADKFCASVAEAYSEYTYRVVTPKVALLDLGYNIDEELALGLFAKVVPPSEPRDGFRLIDPTLAALRAGIGVNRSAWERVYFDAATRALLTAGDVAVPKPEPKIVPMKDVGNQP